MINQMNQNENTQNQFSNAFKELQLGKLLRKASAMKSNCYQDISDKIDRRTNGYKTRRESLLAKPDAALLLVRWALNAGIKADCVLMDTPQ